MKSIKNSIVSTALLVIASCGLGCGETPDASSGSGGEGGEGSASTGVGAGGASTSSSAGGGGVGAGGMGNGGMGDGGMGGAGGSGGMGSGGAGGAGGNAPPILPACYETCASADDCVTAGSPLFDADNWSCTSGTCAFNGCNSSQECTAAYNNPNYVCEAVQGSSFKTCFMTCVAAADCATPGSPVVDADNWSCAGGRCEYKGCNSTQECIDTYNNPNFTCAASPGSSIKGCFETCASPADCATPGSPIVDADNWACNGNTCEYTGCNSTQECVTAYNNPNYVCK